MYGIQVLLSAVTQKAGPPPKKLFQIAKAGILTGRMCQTTVSKKHHCTAFNQRSGKI